MEAAKLAASVTVESDSPWFYGHFPNNPILPGIAQLKMVVDLIAGLGAGNLSIAGLSRIKFRKIVRPGEQLDLQVTGSEMENQYLFRITSGDEDVCSGKMLFTHNNTLQIHE